MKKILFTLLMMGAFLLPVPAQEKEYVILVHGGAGVMTALQDHPEQRDMYYAALDSALQIGERQMQLTGKGADVVLAVINYFESNPLFNSGIGATVSAAGQFELDACIMEGKDLSAGAVAGVKHIKHPINAAYAVKKLTPHVMLSGDGADQFAAENGLETVNDNLYFATPKTMQWVEKFKEESKKNGTVGCVVLDKDGNLTAGTSTGGMLGKKYGRIGDAPIIGSGTYADNAGCAVSCTGHGEYFIRHAVSSNLNFRVKFMKQPIDEAANEIIFQELNSEEGNGGLIAVDKEGNYTMPFNSGGMFRGVLYREKNTGYLTEEVGIFKEVKKLIDEQSDLVGAFTRQRAVTKEDLNVFNEATKGYKEKLIPLSVGTQVVAGINYLFICKRENGSKVSIKVFKPLKGKPRIIE